uniref:PNO1 second type I KH domain-containing protein n=1 Tax=Periophthalmus magnuspinnatus TaxID=409849 RepID=A0A3B4A2N2_9GOBI
MDLDKSTECEKAATEGNQEESESFTKVKSKKTQKRKREQDGVDMDTADSVASKRPQFPPISGDQLRGPDDMRKIAVPAHRYTPLKENWLKIFTPIVENLQLQVRFNLKTRNVEIKVSCNMENICWITFAILLKHLFLDFKLKLDELFLESFDVTDVKPLKGDHLSRAIGRIAGKGGKTKFTIENVTKTRIVLADTNCICFLLIGNPPSKVYGNIRVVRKERTREYFH